MPKIVLIVATLALLSIPAPGSAQSTINLHFTITAAGDVNQPWGPPLTTFRKGDVLTMTAVLHAGIPPNDLNSCTKSGLFPGLFVYIAYNNGFNPTVIFRDVLESPIGFGPYVLDVDNGTLYATVRCVTADLDVNLQHPSKWRPDQKAAAQRYSRSFQGWAWFFGTLGLPCIAIPGPAGMSCRLTAELFATATGGTAWLMGRIADDPSDPNFMVIAQPQPIVLPTGMDCGDFTECNNLLANDLQIISLERAILTTNDRIQGAIDAFDTFWEDQQTQALRQYQIQLASLASQNATLTQAYQAAFISRMAAAGVKPIVLSAADVATFQSNTQGGWTFDQQNTFAAMGFTPQDMDDIRAFLLTQDTSTLGGSDFPEVLTRGDFYSTVSAVITSMGNGTQVIPAPPVRVSIGALKLSGQRYTLPLLSTATFNATQVAQNTITFGRTGTETTPLSCSNSDNNKDKRMDKVCTFDKNAAGFQTGDTLAWVRFVYNGTRFIASTPK